MRYDDRMDLTFTDKFREADEHLATLHGGDYEGERAGLNDAILAVALSHLNGQGKTALSRFVSDTAADTEFVVDLQGERVVIYTPTHRIDLSVSVKRTTVA